MMVSHTILVQQTRSISELFVWKIVDQNTIITKVLQYLYLLILIIGFVPWGRNRREEVWVMMVCFEKHGLPPLRVVIFSNGNCCNITSATKTPIFSIVNDGFPFSQNCMKPWSKKNLTDEEILLLLWYYY